MRSGLLRWALEWSSRALMTNSGRLSTSVVLRKGEASSDLVQRRFAEMVRSYFAKMRSTAAGDQLVDASERLRGELNEELARLNRVYDLAEDKVQFPSFVFADKKFQLVAVMDEEKVAQPDDLRAIDRMAAKEGEGDRRRMDWATAPLETDGYALQIFADDGVNYVEPTVRDVVDNDYLLCAAEEEQLYDDDKFVLFKHLEDPPTIPKMENITSKEASHFQLRF